MQNSCDLQLYIRFTCPYCVKVLNYMDRHGVEIALHDISANDEDRLFLIKNGGKQQVPCLFIDGEPLYESDDIIAWIGKNLCA